MTAQEEAMSCWLTEKTKAVSKSGSNSAGISILWLDSFFTFLHILLNYHLVSFDPWACILFDGSINVYHLFTLFHWLT